MSTVVKVVHTQASPFNQTPRPKESNSRIVAVNKLLSGITGRKEKRGDYLDSKTRNSYDINKTLVSLRCLVTLLNRCNKTRVERRNLRQSFNYIVIITKGMTV